MSNNIGVGFRIFADASQFQRGIAQAKDSVDGVGKALKQFDLGPFGKLLGAGGVGLLVNGFIDAARAAQDLRDEADRLGTSISDSTRRAAEFADSIDSAKKSLTDVAISTIGGISKIGESLGAAEVVSRRTFSNILEGISELNSDKILGAFNKAIDDTNNALELTEKTARAAAEAEKELAKSREENSPEKLAAAEEKLAAVRKQSALERLSGEEKILELQRQVAEQEQKVASLGANTVKRKEEEIELERLRNSLVKEIASSEKAAQEESRKAAQETAKLAKERMLSAEQEVELVRLQAKQTTGLTSEERARLDVLMLQKEQLSIQSEIKRILEDGSVTEQERATLLELDKQTQELQKQIELKQGLIDLTPKQIEAEKNVTKEIQIQTEQREKNQKAYENVTFGLFNGTGNAQLQQASDEALKELVRRNRSEMQGLDEGSAFRWGDSIKISRLRSEANRAQDELDFRNELRRDIRVLGVDGARRNSDLDPLAFDRVVSSLNLDNRDISERQLSAQEETNRLLRQKFKNQ